jgi:hypothetical protein
MSHTIPHDQPPGRHLSLVDDMQQLRNGIGEVHEQMIRYVTTPGKPVLNRAGALKLDQAELFLLSLDTEMLTADSLRAAYLLGLAEVHLAGLIELFRSVTT